MRDPFFIASMAMVGVVALAVLVGLLCLWKQQRGEKAPLIPIEQFRAKEKAAKDLAGNLEAAREEEAVIRIKQCSVKAKEMKRPQVRDYTPAKSSNEAPSTSNSKAEHNFGVYSGHSDKDLADHEQFEPP